MNNLTLYKYPAHSDDFFLVTSKEGFEILKTIREDFGGEPFNDVFRYHAAIGRSKIYRKWIQENIDTAIKILEPYYLVKEENIPVWPDFFKPRLCIPGNNLDLMVSEIPPKFKQDIEFGLESGEMCLGIELSDDPLENWKEGAITFILEKDLDIKVKFIEYGSEDHRPWLDLVLD